MNGRARGGEPAYARCVWKPTSSWAIAIAVLASASAPARAEFCGAVGLGPQVVSGVDAVLPSDGGILVAALPGRGDHEGDPADQPTWRFHAAGASTTPRRTTLAPGLVVYQARQDGGVVLLDHEGTQVAGAFVTRRPRPRLMPPVVRWTVRMPDRADVLLQLATEPPEDALAIVLVGKDGKPRSWDFLDPESTVQRAHKQRGCEIQPAGTVASIAGDEVTFVFVDTWGRTSAPSRPIQIASKPPSETRLQHERAR